MHEIVIPMVPSRNILGQSRWWRNSHNDREVWESVVKQSLRDCDADSRPPYHARVVCDWQARSMPVATDKMKQELVKVVRSGLYVGGGFVLDRVDVDVKQSGRGQGETRIYLERA